MAMPAEPFLDTSADSKRRVDSTLLGSVVVFSKSFEGGAVVDSVVAAEGVSTVSETFVPDLAIGSLGSVGKLVVFVTATSRPSANDLRICGIKNAAIPPQTSHTASIKRHEIFPTRSNTSHKDCSGMELGHHHRKRIFNFWQSL